MEFLADFEHLMWNIGRIKIYLKNQPSLYIILFQLSGNIWNPSEEKKTTLFLVKANSSQFKNLFSVWECSAYIETNGRRTRHSLDYKTREEKLPNQYFWNSLKQILKYLVDCCYDGISRLHGHSQTPDVFGECFLQTNQLSSI